MTSIEICTDGIDKNELVQKIEKLELYIRKAKSRLIKQEQELEKLYEAQTGDRAETYQSLKRLKLVSKQQSIR